MHMLVTPISNAMVNRLILGQTLTISGRIFTGRDAVLPRLVALIKEGRLADFGIDLEGSAIFHTAVSNAGVGPTSSNKLEIETSISELSRAGVKLHLGKGALKTETIEALHKHNAAFATVPPVTALLESKIKSRQLVAFPEEGMEALHMLVVEDFPAIISAIHGQTLFDNRP